MRNSPTLKFCDAHARAGFMKKPHTSEPRSRIHWQGGVRQSSVESRADGGCNPESNPLPRQVPNEGARGKDMELILPVAPPPREDPSALWSVQLQLLSLAEDTLGPRDISKVIYQPIFTDHDPNIRNTPNLDGAFAELSRNAEGYWPTVAKELAHETVHLLNPKPGNGTAIIFPGPSRVGSDPKWDRRSAFNVICRPRSRGGPTRPPTR